MLDQPWFLNQVIETETTLFPRQLLARLLMIEREMGRMRVTPKGPRTIDLDILLFGNAVVHAAGLEIPHPRLSERRFVLEPLAELIPDLRPPRGRRTVREMLAVVMDQPVRRFVG
jgi:2-amino-4-hydroxy-6-hydroxymethyldihydropteridine diphosphokinase